MVRGVSCGVLCVLIVACCGLFVLRDSGRVECSLLFARVLCGVRCSMCVVCCVLCIMRWLVVVVSCVVCFVYCVLSVVCCVLCDCLLLRVAC